MSGSLDEHPQELPSRYVQEPGTDQADVGAPASESQLGQRVAEAIQPLLPQLQEQVVHALQAQLREAFPSGNANGGPEPTDSTDGDSANGAGTVGTLVRPLMDSVPDVLREQAEQPLRSLVPDALDTIFSDSVRARFQREAEELLQELLDIALELIPDEEDRRALRRQVRQTLAELLDDTLDRIFSGAMRADIESHAERAIDAVVDGEGDEAIQQGKLALLALFDDLSAVLQEHWGQVLRLLLRVVATALQQAITAAIKKGFASIVSEPAEELSEQTDTVQDRLQAKGEELREELEHAIDTLRERVQEGAEELQKRLEESVRSSVSNERNPRGGAGRPPSGRPPFGRPPSGRPPSGRPPSARAPVGMRAAAPRSRRPSR